MEFSGRKSHFVLKILFLLCVASHDQLNLLRVVLAGDPDIWPFDNLNQNMDKHGNAGNSSSPVGTGLYLDGSDNTYVKIKGHNKNCLKDPSTCDISIGFFFKLGEQSDTQIIFGNKDNNENLYKGVNIFYKQGKIHVWVYGQDKFCRMTYHPPLGVWFYLGLVWEKVGRLAVKVDSWFKYVQLSKDGYCGDSPSGLLTRRDYFLGRHTFPIAYYRDLTIWYSIQDASVLQEKWAAAFDNGGGTVLNLTIIFSELAYATGNATQWENIFTSEVEQLFTADETFEEIKEVSVLDSGGNASVTFRLQFTRVSWQAILALQLALENGTFLGSRGVFDEAGCYAGDHFFCQVPQNPTVNAIAYNLIYVLMDPVLEKEHEGYLLGYRLLYKNLDIPNSPWEQREYRRNVPPINPSVHGLLPYTNYSLRVMAASFQSEGLISEALYARTHQWVPYVGPEIVACYNTSSTTIYVQWNHTIPQKKVNGILIGYRVGWRDDFLEDDNPYKIRSHKDVGLDATNYTVTSLHEDMLHKVGVAGRTAVGDGEYTVVTRMTPDDAPSSPPVNVRLDMNNSTSLSAFWEKLPYLHRNGIILGYRVQLQQENGGPVVWNTTVGANLSSFTLTDLLSFQNYSVQAMAFNRIGAGPYNDKVYQMTDESVPINSPTNLQAHNISSNAIQVQWNYNDNPRLLLGDLLGFTLYFLEANASDVFTENTQLRTYVKGVNTSTVIDGLKIFRLYKISIAARNSKGVGPTNESVTVRTHGEAPGSPPQSLAAYNTSSFSIHAHWQDVVTEKHHGIMQGYKLSLYEWTNEGFQNLENRTNGLSAPEANFTGLRAFRKHRIEVLGFNNFGDGPFAAVELLTDESYPSLPPSNFTAVNKSSTILRLFWRHVPECCRFGIIIGYHVTLIDPSNASVILTETTTLLTQRFTKLKKFYVYNLTIEAFNAKGSSPKAFTLASTDQDVPEAAPQNVSGYNISKSEILVSWDPVPKDKVNGIVTEYNVSYSKVEGIPHSGNKVFNGSSLQGIIDGLQPFTVYSFNVSASTIKGQGPVSPAINVKTEEEAPQVSPTQFKGFNTSSTSIALSWNPIPQQLVAGVLRNFFICYRELNTDDNTTHTISVPLTTLSIELNNLRKYTNYSLVIKGATKFVGVPTEPIVIITDEDIPSLPPQDIELQGSSSTSIYAQWNPIPKDSVNGIPLGIKLVYRSAPTDNSIVHSSRARRAIEEDWSEYTNITLPPSALSYELTSLKKFTNYSIAVFGFTAKGEGNVSQQFIVSSDEDVPSKPPTAFVPMSRSGDFKMNLTWGPVPDGFVHGILLGYRIYFKKTQEMGRSSSSETRVVTFAPNDYHTTITLLNNFAVYGLEITAFTSKGEGPRSEIKEGSTCNCPRVFKTTWYPFAPYIAFENGSVGGFIPKILDHAVQACCSDCKQANGKSASVINFELDGKGNPGKKTGVEELISSIDSDTDFSVPVNGYEGQTHYSLYRFVKLAESPGVGFIIVMDNQEKIDAVANLFFYSWPVLVLCTLMMVAAGIVMWILDTRSNRAEFPGSFFQGAFEGFWWSFVTCTTVGYGDKCPKGVLSRLFAIGWTLCGLVVIATLIGTIATALTQFGYSGPYISLYGTKVAAISNNSDFRLGIRKNAKMDAERSYKTYEEISQALANQEVKGALLDLYVLSSHKHLFQDPRFRIVRIYDYKTSYGVVLAGHSMKLEECFTEHIKGDAADVFASIEENVKILKGPDASPAEQQSTELFDATSTKFITSVTVIGILLILACVLGITYEIRRDKTGEGLTQSKDLKNEMSLIVESFLTNIKKTTEATLKRHRRQLCVSMRAEKERDQQAATAVNEYYEVLSSRDIREDWFTKSPAARLSDDAKPTVWPFVDEPNNASVVTKTYSKPATPLFMKRRKQGCYNFSDQFALEPTVRIMDETNL